MKKLEWSKLFCEERIRPGKAHKEKEGIIARNAFEADYDRIVGSSSVRRLQDKAQVFPLQKDDVVRTRLTHSLEVSALARSLGKAVGKQLELQGKFTPDDTDKLAALLQTTGLIHDLGNPPFGHYGEQVIQEWVEKKRKEENRKRKKTFKSLTAQELQDFEYFDGNVQNLRIVTKLQTMNDAHGANFTYATLATLMKYPYKSTNIPDKKEKKKFGYFKSEESIVELIRRETGLEEGMRHPATYLMEAADDIIYICDDIEDGVKKGYINWENEFAKLLDDYSGDKDYGELFEKIKNSKPDENMEEAEKVLARVRVFRNYVQSFLFEKSVEAFLNNYESIMCGNFEGELLKGEKKLIKSLKEITRRCCFSCKEVLALEVAAHKVLSELLSILYDVLITMKNEDADSTKEYAGKVYHIISANYKYIALHDYENDKQKEFGKLTTYDKLHLIVDFVSGMTDSYAVSLYKELTGISLPE